MKFLVIVLGISFFATSCSNSNTTNEKIVIAESKIDTLEAPSYKVPLKVTGAFLGNMPCNDCRLVNRLINLQEISYIIQEHHQGTTDKRKLLVQQTGKCTQDSGLITLYNDKNTIVQQYEIIAADTLRLKAKNKNSTIYFVRKDGKKIVQ